MQRSAAIIANIKLINEKGEMTLNAINRFRVNILQLSGSIYQKAMSSKSEGSWYEDITSIHAGQIEEVHDVPMEVITRPFPPEVNEDKVQSLMDTLKDPQKASSVPPVDILWIKGRKGGDYYYSFGGCHRYTAHKRLGRPTIKAKLVKSTIEDLRSYLGGSTPDLK